MCETMDDGVRGRIQRKRNRNQGRPGRSKCVVANKDIRMNPEQQIKTEMQAKYLILMGWQLEEVYVAG